MLKSFFINSFLYLFLLSFLVSDSIFISLYFSFFKIYLTDFLFIIFIFFIVIKYYVKIYDFIISLLNFFPLDLVIFLILIIHIIKFFLDFNNTVNLIELLKYLYVFGIYFTFRFLIFCDNNFENHITYGFYFIFFASMIILLFSIFAYYFDLLSLGNQVNEYIIKNIESESPKYLEFNEVVKYDCNSDTFTSQYKFLCGNQPPQKWPIFNLWEIKNIYHPYFGNPTVHFNGFLNFYNMQAYIMIPGFLLFNINKNLDKPFFYFSLLFIFCLILFFVKSKVLLIVFFISFLFYFYFKFKEVLFSKYIFIFSVLFFVIFYFIFTHFVFLDSSMANNYDPNLYTYYTANPIFKLFDINIYGSLFYKLKFIAIAHAKSYNFLFFDSLNYNDFFYLFSNNYGSDYMFSKDLNFGKDYKAIYNLDAHSDYFFFLSNFGLIGFSLIVYLLLYPLKVFISLKKFTMHKNLYIYFLILLVFIIESINADLLHLRLYWIILAIFTINYKKIINVKD